MAPAPVETIEEIHSSQAAAVPFSAAQNSTADAAAMENGVFSSNRGIELRPSVAIQWFSIQGNRPDNSLISANWVGVKSELDTAFVRFPILELGTDLSAYRTMTGFVNGAGSSSVTDLNVGGYALFKANTLKFGVPMFRLSSGYYGNWRASETPMGFLPGVSGAKVSAELSAIVDQVFAFGLSGSYVAAQAGLFDVGAFLSQRLSSQMKTGTWSARLGANVSVLRAMEGGDLRRECAEDHRRRGK